MSSNVNFSEGPQNPYNGANSRGGQLPRRDRSNPNIGRLSSKERDKLAQEHYRKIKEAGNTLPENWTMRNDERQSSQLKFAPSASPANSPKKSQVSRQTQGNALTIRSVKPLKPITKNNPISLVAKINGAKRARKEYQPGVSPNPERLANNDLVVGRERIGLSALDNIPPKVMSLDPYVISPEKKTQESPAGYEQVRREPNPLAGGARRKLLINDSPERSDATGFSFVGEGVELWDSFMDNDEFNQTSQEFSIQNPKGFG